MTQKSFTKQYEQNTQITARPEAVFSYADDHSNFSSHMNTSSWMMGGGKMETKTDEGRGQKVGSHITMSGKVFGINLYLDEVITQHEPPYRKAWETIGDINLLVIDHYRLGFEIIPKENASDVRVYINYDLPKSWKTTILGQLLGGMYAKWCVTQMIKSIEEHFRSK